MHRDGAGLAARPGPAPDRSDALPRYPVPTPRVDGGPWPGRRLAAARLLLSWRTSAARALWWLGGHAWLVTAVLCAVVAAVGFRGGDFPAQDYRVWIFKTHGFLIWDVNWYGGHADLGYSVLFPAVGAVLGTVPAASIACVSSTMLFGRLIGPSRGWPAALSRLWFAVFVVGDLVVGRAPFACSTAFALATVLAVRRDRTLLATAAAIVTSLFSPLGAAFLLLIAAAWSPSLGVRRALPFAGALVGLAVAALAGDGGVFPFPWTGFVGQLLIAGIGLVVTPRSRHTLRRTLWLYGFACIVLFFVPNPVGGNIARLAGLVIGPVAAYVLLRAHRGRALLVLAVPLLVFQLQPVVSAVATAAGDPSTKPQYYQGVVRFLEAHRQPLGRVEIPFTRQHWEATYVAERVPLARGWDRQVDVSRNAVLYQPLSAQSYASWLRSNAVRYVALPDAPLDQGGRAEGTLLQHPPDFLTPVYADSHWKVWQVSGSAPLAKGVATMTDLTASGFTLSSAQAGATLVRLRWSPYWHVDAGYACVAPAEGGWTEVVSLATGQVKVSARVRIQDEDACTTDQLAGAGITLDENGKVPAPVS